MRDRVVLNFLFPQQALKFHGIINGYHEAIDLFMVWVENPRIFPNLQVCMRGAALIPQTHC